MGKKVWLTASLLVLLAGTAAAIPDTPIRAMRWLAKGAPAAKLMAQKPSECLARPKDANLAYSVEVGRAAFNTPLLLGGQAARAGIQCETCHRGGRTNPDFFFPGVSGKPGTVDVTTAVFSSHRDDGINNPKPIPDLSGPREKLKVSRDPNKPDLRNFIHGLVTQEFDGDEPPPAVLDGLANYVRALSPASCPANPKTPIRMQSVMADARRAVAAGQGALVRHDNATAILMMASARTQLGLLDERYQGQTRERLAIRAADQDLAAIQSDIRGGRPGLDERLAAWTVQSATLEQQLAQSQSRSLFDPAQLAALTAGH